jgi:amino acid efflux transporter
VKRAFGWKVGTIVGWLFVFSFFVGGPIVAIVAASYVIVSLGLATSLLYPISFGFMCGTILINLTGIKIGSRIESIILGTVVVVLFIAVVLTLPQMHANNFVPFVPKGWSAVGVVAAVIFFSFLGYENVPHMAEEFRNPQRDFKLSIGISVLITSMLYVLTSLATIGTGIYENQNLYAPIALMFSQSLGINAVIVVLFLAITTCFGALNAYSIGVSRLVFALARDRSMPSALHELNSRVAPARALVFIFIGATVGLVVDAMTNARLGDLFLVSGAGFIAVYIFGSASAVKLLKLKGLKRIFPYLTFIVSVIAFSFVGKFALFPLVICMLAIVWIRRTNSKI